MPAPRLRALVLAAGRGERLRPLTATVPKPLLPVAGRPLVAWTLARLRDAGCEAVALNLHHLGERIRTTFGDSFRGMPLVWSDEPELLGTGGALPPLRDFFAPADEVAVVNGDSLCRWPFEALLREHRKHRPAATLLVARNIAPRPFGGGVAIEGRGIVAFRPTALAHAGARRHRVFAGAQIVARPLLERLSPGPSDLVSAFYEPLLADGAPLLAIETARLWHDLGTPGRYLEGVLDFAFRGSTKAWRAVRGAEVGERVDLRRTVVEAGAQVATGARLRNCLVLPGATVGAGARLRGAIVGPGADVAPGVRADDTLFTRAAADQPTIATPIR
ncbi:MAG: sugar phosphate nucleotidyltransferase [Thermoanaerobaculia bacterium]